MSLNCFAIFIILGIIVATELGINIHTVFMKSQKFQTYVIYHEISSEMVNVFLICFLTRYLV